MSHSSVKNEPARPLVKSAWFFKKILNFLPAKKSNIPEKDSVLSIGYLFSGTYGDVVQCLPSLHKLRAAFPTASIHIYMSQGLFEDFKSLLPKNIKRAHGGALCLWIFQPRSLILTNVVGVFRVGFEYGGRFCARRSLGFCYTHERGRNSYAFCLQLTPDYQSNVVLNNQLLDNVYNNQSFIPIQSQDKQAAPLTRPVNDYIRKGRPLLFHLGSAGFKRDVGTPKYLEIITGLVGFFQEQEFSLTLLAGPSDTQLIQHIESSFSTLKVESYALPGLQKTLQDFEGTVLCFNSFFAHFSHYLKKKSVVIHHNRIPRGYDCSPQHLQIILKDEDNLDLNPLLEAFKGAL